VVHERLEREIRRKLGGASFQVRGVGRIARETRHLVDDESRVQWELGQPPQRAAGRELLLVFGHGHVWHALHQRPEPEPTREEQRIQRGFGIEQAAIERTALIVAE
jgi:hypothetical protein